MPSSSSWSPCSLQRVGMALALLVGSLVLLMTGCTSGAPSDRDVLISLTDQVVVPAYQAVADDAARLDQDATALCVLPDAAGLERARQSWRSARASWLRSRAVWFGPVMDRRSISLLDWSPTDTEGIDGLLGKGAAVDANQVRNLLSANRRGFGAVEYLLFQPDALARLKDSPAYCAYLSALTEVAREEAAAILTDWTGGGQTETAYRDYFTDRSKLALLPSDAVEEMVRTQVFLIRDMTHMRMATALGLRSGELDLSAIPGNAAENGLADLRDELLGLQTVYQGAGGAALGISDLVQPLSGDTDQRMRDQLTAAIAAADAVDGPLRVAIVGRPEQVNALYDRLADLQRILATEAVSLLGVSVGFSDTDGDSLR